MPTRRHKGRWLEHGEPSSVASFYKTNAKQVNSITDEKEKERKRNELWLPELIFGMSWNVQKVSLFLMIQRWS